MELILVQMLVMSFDYLMETCLAEHLGAGWDIIR